MYGMSDMLGCTYEYVNVILFCFVEPVLTILMVMGTLYALLRLPKAKWVAYLFMWFGIIVSSLTGLLLIVSAIHALSFVDIMDGSYVTISLRHELILLPDPDPVIHDLFQKTMHWLLDTSNGNMGYNALNLLIYVLLMPLLIVLSIYACYRTSKEIIKEHTMKNTKLRMAERVIICIDVILIAALAFSIFLAVCPKVNIDTATVILSTFYLIGILSFTAVYLNLLRLASSIKEDGCLKHLVIWAPVVYGAGVVIITLCSLFYDRLYDTLIYTLVALSLMGYFTAGILTLITSSHLADHLQKHVKETEITNQSNIENI